MKEFELKSKLNQLYQLQNFNKFKRRILSEIQVLELNKEIRSILTQIEDLKVIVE